MGAPAQHPRRDQPWHCGKAGEAMAASLEVQARKTFVADLQKE
jgi:hypothetical protein